MARPSDDTLYNLPDTSTLDRTNKRKIDALLREAHSLRAAIKRLDAIKKELREAVETHGLVSEDGKFGVRSGELCMTMHWTSGRKSLDREKLIENGVTLKQIESSMKEGNGYYTTNLSMIGEGNDD